MRRLRRNIRGKKNCSAVTIKSIRNHYCVTYIYRVIVTRSGGSGQGLVYHAHPRDKVENCSEIRFYDEQCANALMLYSGPRSSHVRAQSNSCCVQCFKTVYDGSKCDAADAFGLFNGQEWWQFAEYEREFAEAGVEQRFQSCHSER